VSLKEKSMNRTVLSTVFVAVLSATITAQSGNTMNTDHDARMGAKMDNMADATYTGCLQAGSTARTFILSGATRMMTNSMPGGVTAADGMNHQMMAMTTLTVMATSVDLRKSVGRKVSVTGSSQPGRKDAMGNEVPTLTVKSLKVVAASCS
jgi:hypothetical protein